LIVPSKSSPCWYEEPSLFSKKIGLAELAKPESKLEPIIIPKHHDNHKTIGDAIYGLVCPVAYISIGGNKYGLVIVDDYSRFSWVLFMQDKSETQEVLKKFLKMAQNEFDSKVKKIRSDNGTEFKNTQVEEFLDEEGIKHEFLAPYTPQ
jgi:IS30 family transposase